MKAMIIGIRPQYVYPGSLETWAKNNTLYSANMGASLICNSLLRQFDADYIDNFENIDELRNKYDVCILALATHLHPTRDISFFTDIVKKLELKTIVLSAGIKDYDNNISLDYDLHPSVIELMQIASSSSSWIGVRGHYSASVLHRHGFKNVVPIGCPSFYWGLSPDLKINKNETFLKAITPYHLTLANSVPEFIKDKALLGQDFQDEAIFTNNLEKDQGLQRWIKKQYSPNNNFISIKKSIEKNGIFFNDFSKWFQFIGQHDFVIGPRLHGCICGLINRIPTVMIPRDMRVKEISEFYKIPCASYEDLKKYSLYEIYSRSDYSYFNEVYSKRYNNYVNFLNENGLTNKLKNKNTADFNFTLDDALSIAKINQSQVAELISRVSKLEETKNENIIKKIRKYIHELRK